MANSVKTLSVYLNLQSKAFQTGLRKTERSLKKFGSTMSNIGSQMTSAITLPMVAAGAGAIKLASDFESSMTKIQTLVGLPASEVENLKNQVLDLAGETAQAPKSLADGLYFLTSAGLDSESAMKALESVSKGVASGLGEQTDLAKVASAAQNAYGEDVLSASESLDIFGSMVKTGMFEASELANVLGTQLGLASNLGISMEELGAMISTYTRTTGDANSATTGLSGIMMSFAKITPKAEKALDKVGLSVEGVRESIGQRGLQATLLDMQKRFADNNVDLSEFFSKSQALKGVLGVLGNQTESYKNVLEELGDSQGFVNEAFKTTSETSAFQFQQALTDLKVAGTELGTTIMPIASKIATKISDLAKAFSNLGEDARKKIIKLAAAIGLVAPALSIIGKISTVAGGLIGTFRKLGIAVKAVAVITSLFNPFTYVLVGIGLILVGMVKHFDNLKEPMVNVINYFIKLYNESARFKIAIESIGFAFGYIWESAKFLGNSLVTMFKGVGKVLINLFDKDARNAAIKELLDGMSGNFDDFAKNTKDKWDNMQENLTTRELEPISVDDIDGAIDKGQQWGENLVSGIQGVVSNMSSQMGDLMFSPTTSGTGEGETTGGGETTGEGEETNNPLSPNVEETVSKWQLIKEGIVNALDGIKISSEELGNTFTGTFNEMADSASMSLKSVKDAVYSNVRDVIKAKLAETVASYAASVFGTMPFPVNIALASASGAIIGGLFNSILPPLAAGGLATGMTAALVGEGRGTSLTNPEVIAPLDKLKSMLPQGSGRLHGMISGNDILLSNVRSVNVQSRVSGSVTNF